MMRMRRLILLGTLPPLLLALGCAGTRVPKTVKKQRKAREDFELVRQGYFDTADIATAREGLAELMDDWLGHIPDEVFDLQDRMDRVQDLELAVDSYRGLPADADCGAELARLRRERLGLATLLTTSHGAEKARMTRLQRTLDTSEVSLRECVLRQAGSLAEQDRLLATSTDPAVLRPIIDERDAALSSTGGLNDILPYLRLTRGYRHSPALIAKTDGLLLAETDRDLIAAYLFYYADHRHDDALFGHLDRLFLDSQDWTAMEAYLQRFHNRPHVSALETKLIEYYRREFTIGARLWDEEKFAEAVGHLAVVAPRSPQFGPARSLLGEAARLGYYRWDLPEVWVVVPPYRWPAQGW